MTNYIKSGYLSNSETLLEYANDLLYAKSEETNIAKEPYIETAASYKKVPNGINNLRNVDENVKSSLIKLVEAKLGIYSTPFQHQIEALENYAQGRDLLVSTGTGSGKTECFLWPIIYKAFEEAINREDSFEQNAVRTLIIYPMNALVSDQIARFRKIIGDKNGNFKKIFIHGDLHQRKARLCNMRMKAKTEHLLPHLIILMSLMTRKCILINKHGLNTPILLIKLFSMSIWEKIKKGSMCVVPVEAQG